MSTDDLLNVTTSDGKYTLIQTAEGKMKALRYGEPWEAGTQDAIGNKRLLVFAQDLAEARAESEKLRSALMAAARYDETTVHYSPGSPQRVEAYRQMVDGFNACLHASASPTAE